MRENKREDRREKIDMDKNEKLDENERRKWLMILVMIEGIKAMVMNLVGRLRWSVARKILERREFEQSEEQNSLIENFHFEVSVNEVAIVQPSVAILRNFENFFVAAALRRFLILEMKEAEPRAHPDREKRQKWRERTEMVEEMKAALVSMIFVAVDFAVSILIFFPNFDSKTAAAVGENFLMIFVE